MSFAVGQRMLVRKYWSEIVVGCLLAGCILAGCQPDGVCIESLQVRAGVSAIWTGYNSSGPYGATTWDSLRVQGVGSDSVYWCINSARGYLPLRATAPTSAFQLQWHGHTDTLFIDHSNDTIFVDMSCGCTVYHTINELHWCGAIIDSADIINAAVTTADESHIVLYLHDYGPY